jgi:formate hydrogenlyase subunit 3/multisubunit Na+/H+ antiporter MnhD subunit
MKNPTKIFCLTLIFAIIGLPMFGGCSGRGMLRKSHELEVVFVSLA